MNDIWKQFDRNELSHSGIHHLLAISDLMEKNGYVRGTDIADYLNITRGSVSITLKKLRKKGYISEDENKFLKLSKKGQVLITRVNENHRLVELLLSDILGVPQKIAAIDACKIAHLISKETCDRLADYLEYSVNLHGDKEEIAAK